MSEEDTEKNAEQARLARKLRGSIGYAYISQAAAFQFIDAMDKLDLYDKREHTTETDCWCRPYQEEQENGNLVVIHNRFGRRTDAH